MRKKRNTFYILPQQRLRQALALGVLARHRCAQKETATSVSAGQQTVRAGSQSPEQSLETGYENGHETGHETRHETGHETGRDCIGAYPGKQEAAKGPLFCV